MANHLVIFPVTKYAEAIAYKNAVDAHYAATFEPGGVFAYIRNDRFGQWVVPFYGPPWEFITGQPFIEPPECEALREDGVIHDTISWPEDDD